MDTWTLDAAHANVEFSVKHMMITTIRGQFRELEVDVDLDEAAPERSTVAARIATASITTNQEQRDGHLRSPDFFDVATYPQILFKSTRIEKVGGPAYKVHGDLTIKDRTRPVVLDAELLDTFTGMQGGRLAAVSADTTINRKDWGLTWNVALESGGWLVGDEVKVHLEFELKAPAAELARELVATA